MPRRIVENRVIARFASRVALAFCLAPVVLAAAPAAAADEPLWTSQPAAPGKAKPTVTLPSIAPVIDRSEPAVLVVFTDAEFDASMLPPGHPPFSDEDGVPFPVGPDGQMPEIHGQGAGFLISPKGYAITNHHVVENATSIRVVVGESHEEIPAVVVGSDEKTDVALLHLESNRTDWPVIPLGDSDALAVGDFVVAIGSPFGLEQSVSLGIISGRGRRDIAPSGRQGIYDFLQTDASINPGNSGGPLLNLAGEVVGMNAAVNTAGAGIGFAIPINMVKRLLPSLREKGRFERAWIGVTIESVMPEMAKGFGLDRARGALITETVAAGPAAQAGLIPGDIVLRFDGRPIENSADLPLLAGDGGVGRAIELSVHRDGAVVSKQIVLGSHPDNEKQPVVKKKKATPMKEAPLGISVATVAGDDRARLKLKTSTSGARVTRVRPGSPAFLAGLSVDDVIVELNHQPTKSSSDFANQVRSLKKGDLMRLLVLRGESTVFVPMLKP